MDWLSKALDQFCDSQSPTGFWKELSDNINPNNPAPCFGGISDYLESHTYLLGSRLSANDFYLVSKLMSCPPWSKILTSKTRPFHICRWFWHIFSLFPNPSFEFYLRRNEKIDGRLVQAIEQNNMGLFEILLELVDVNARSPDESGMKPIHAAAKHGNLTALDKLLSLGVSIETEDIEGLTPLFYAAQGKSLEAFNYLRQRKANVFHVEKQGRSLFYWAASLGRIEMLDILTGDGLDPNQTTILGRTALSKSAWNGNVEVLRHLLQIPGIDIEISDKRGRTPLHNAVWGSAGGREGRKMGQNAKDSPECAKLLLDKGANIEAVDRGNNTPLCIACSTYSPKSVRLLLAHGASRLYPGASGYNPYLQALSRGNIKCAQIVLDSGFDLHSMGKGLTPLQVAIKFLQLKSAKWLISQGITPREEDIVYCLNRSEPEMLEFLLQYTVPENLVEIALEQGNIQCAVWVVSNYPLKSADVVSALRKDKKLGESVVRRWEGEITPEILEAMIEVKLDTSEYLQRAVPTGRILRLAIKQGNYALSLKILGNSPDLHRDTDHFSGNTALHIACMSGLSELIPKLIQLSQEPQAYITAPNHKGMVPVVLAQAHKHLYIAEMLKDMITQATGCMALSQVKKLQYEIVNEELTTHPCASDMPVGYWRAKVPLRNIEDTLYLWVDNSQSLKQMVSELHGVNVLGVDLEYHVFSHKRGCLCLVQISTGDKDYIIDALSNREEVGIVVKEIMEDPEVVKILHGADSDMMWLQNDFDAHPVRIFDTGRAYKIANSDPQLPSLAALLYVFFNLKIDKSFQVAEWRIRPLPAPMLEYARNDAHYLPELFNRLLDQLTPTQLSTLNSQCNALCLKTPKGRLDRLKIITD